MPTAHLYVFSDACPSDWLENGHDDVWHTIVNIGFQSAPELQAQIETGAPHSVVLEQDPQWLGMIRLLRSLLPSGQIRKWRTGPGYRASFSRGFAEVWSTFRPLVSACSFQEKTLRLSKDALLKSYNEQIGGLEGRGIGFEPCVDKKGRLCIKHSFVDL